MTSTETKLTLDVKVAGGKTNGTVDLPAEIFDAPANIALLHQVVVAQLAAARQGTHSTKTRGDVRGGGKKPYRQKGTGRARQGSTRAPQFVGGGTVHGPQPRDYSQRTPKKMKQPLFAEPSLTAHATSASTSSPNWLQGRRLRPRAQSRSSARFRIARSCCSSWVARM